MDVPPDAGSPFHCEMMDDFSFHVKKFPFIPHFFPAGTFYFHQGVTGAYICP